jgi:hypothetical protein
MSYFTKGGGVERLNLYATGYIIGSKKEAPSAAFFLSADISFSGFTPGYKEGSRGVVTAQPVILDLSAVDNTNTDLPFVTITATVGSSVQSTVAIPLTQMNDGTTTLGYLIRAGAAPSGSPVVDATNPDLPTMKITLLINGVNRSVTLPLTQVLNSAGTVLGYLIRT